MADDIKELTKTLIEAKIIQSFKDTPEAIDALVKSALATDVNEWGGKPDTFSRRQMPYLEWLVGDVIRTVARDAVIAAVAERKDEIAEAVRKSVTADKMVDGLTSKILGVLAEDYRLNITFADETKR